jgi:tRNA (adenine57-N1/adenine58-N1)-methyltransferase
VEKRVIDSKPGDIAMLLTERRKRFFVLLTPGDELQTHEGIFLHDTLIGAAWGSIVESHLGERCVMLQPTLQDLLLHIKRRSQIIFPKDIGYILLQLSIRPGATVMELGTGSGALTTALAWTVGPTGRVISYDRREDFQALAKENLTRLGLEGRVEFRLEDISTSQELEAVDALFMDLPKPEQYLSQVHAALSNGGTFGAILPTTNQVSELLTEMQRHPFEDVDVCEILLRHYKRVPERLRPADRMVAHTGFLVFARATLERLGGI